MKTVVVALIAGLAASCQTSSSSLRADGAGTTATSRFAPRELEEVVRCESAPDFDSIYEVVVRQKTYGSPWEDVTYEVQGNIVDATTRAPMSGMTYSTVIGHANPQEVVVSGEEVSVIAKQGADARLTGKAVMVDFFPEDTVVKCAYVGETGDSLHADLKEMPRKLPAKVAVADGAALDALVASFVTEIEGESGRYIRGGNPCHYVDLAETRVICDATYSVDGDRWQGTIQIEMPAKDGLVAEVTRVSYGGYH